MRSIQMIGIAILIRSTVYIHTRLYIITSILPIMEINRAPHSNPA